MAKKHMEILEAFDLTRSARSAADLASCDPKTVRHCVGLRDAGLDSWRRMLHDRGDGQPMIWSGRLTQSSGDARWQRPAARSGQILAIAACRAAVARAGSPSPYAESVMTRRRDRIAQTILVGFLTAIALPILVILAPSFGGPDLTAIPIGVQGLVFLYCALIVTSSLIWYFGLSHRPGIRPPRDPLIRS